MDEAKQQPSSITGNPTKETASAENTHAGLDPKEQWIKKYLKWFQVAVYAFLILASQTIGTLLGRSYFANGGKSKWLATLAQLVGFPILMPLLFVMPRNGDTSRIKPSTSALAAVYVLTGLLGAANCMFYSIGLQYLPVSTYSLICASQLGFNAIFSVLLNREKLTPYVINSAVLLTMSSVVLVIQNDSDQETAKNPKSKYVLGFLCTILASAGYALTLSLTQLAFQRIIRRYTFKGVVEMSIYQSIVATTAILIGFFASKEWRSLSREMKNFKGGGVYYVNNLVWTAVSWQMFGIGCIGLIFKVSSLFSNAISVVGLPIAPALAVVFFHDKMSAAKIISLLLAIWGFLSYMYQNYLDDLKATADTKPENATAAELVQVA